MTPCAAKFEGYTAYTHEFHPVVSCGWTREEFHKLPDTDRGG